jgi:hypothetical protein
LAAGRFEWANEGSPAQAPLANQRSRIRALAKIAGYCRVVNSQVLKLGTFQCPKKVADFVKIVCES